MLNLGTLKIGIEVDKGTAPEDIQDVRDDIGEVGNDAETASGVVDSSFSLAFAAVAAAAAAAVVEVAKSITQITMQAVGAYAEFEQLTGGVNKLYGDSADAVYANAETAYKRLGISENEYLKGATSFSSALINSLGGDTEKAAQIVDMVFGDMADNANTYGVKTVDELTNVYMALSRENYTLLDNLNLGFAGTKEGMQSLLKKATEISGKEFKLGNFADMVEAIHIIQEEYGITGTTAAEAAGTVEGSQNQMTAAAEDAVAALGKEDGDIQGKIGQLMDSLETYLSNLTPVVDRIVENLPSALETIIDKLGGEEGIIATTLTPERVTKICVAFVKMLGDIATFIIAELPYILTLIVEAIPNVIWQLVESVWKLFTTAVDGTFTMGDWIVEVINRLFKAVANYISTGEWEFEFPTIAEVKAKAELEDKEELDNAFKRVQDNIKNDFIVNGYDQTKIDSVVEVGAQLMIDYPNLDENSFAELLSSQIPWLDQGTALDIWQYLKVKAKVDADTKQIGDAAGDAADAAVAAAGKAIGDQVATANLGDAVIDVGVNTDDIDAAQKRAEILQEQLTVFQNNSTVEQIAKNADDAVKKIEALVELEANLPSEFSHSINLSFTGVNETSTALGDLASNYSTLLEKAKSKIKMHITLNKDKVEKTLEDIGDAWDDILDKTDTSTKEVKLKNASTVYDWLDKIYKKWKQILDLSDTKKLKVKQGDKDDDDGSHRVGLREVPYDGYMAELHKGEAILTAAETNGYQKWLNDQQTDKTQFDMPKQSATAINYDELADALAKSLGNVNVNSVIAIDGRQIATATAPFMQKEIKSLNTRQGRLVGQV